MKGTALTRSSRQSTCRVGCDRSFRHGTRRHAHDLACVARMHHRVLIGDSVFVRKQILCRQVRNAKRGTHPQGEPSASMRTMFNIQLATVIIQPATAEIVRAADHERATGDGHPPSSTHRVAGRGAYGPQGPRSCIYILGTLGQHVSSCWSAPRRPA